MFEISRIWNIEKAKGNKKLEVNVRKQQKLEVIEGITLDVITGDHELSEPEVNVRKQQNPQVNEESTEVSSTEEQKLGELEANV